MEKRTNSEANTALFKCANLSLKNCILQKHLLGKPIEQVKKEIARLLGKTDRTIASYASKGKKLGDFPFKEYQLLINYFKLK